MREGDPGSQFYIVESGKLEVSQSGSVVGEIDQAIVSVSSLFSTMLHVPATVTVQNDALIVA